MRSFAFTLPLRLVTESNTKGHWAAKARRAKEQRHVAFMLTTTHLVLETRSPAVHSLLPCHITMTRVAPRRLDVDNLWSSFKHVIDGIADAFHLPDNDPRFEWDVAQDRGGPNHYSVRIQIEPKRESNDV